MRSDTKQLCPVTPFPALTQLLASPEFEGNGWMTIESFTNRESAGEVVLDVRSLRDDFERQRWRLTCEDLRACRVSVEPVDDVQVLERHVLLARFHDAHAKLAFTGRVPDPRHVVADLRTRHIAIAGAWVPFETYLNPSLPLAELFSFSGGILAEGPRRFLDAYADVLAVHGAEASLLHERPPMRWNGEAWEHERQDVKLMLLSPDSWLIGARFAAERLHDGAIDTKP